jgi:hypothetical protein
MLHRILAALLLWAAAGASLADFHLWRMDELYSSPDGTVQFLELRSLTSGQQFVGDHTLSTSSGGVTRTFTFPADLPGESGGRRMLIGTQAFAALGVVAPDFVVPNGFFFQGGGTINFAGGADTWNHPALPANGNDSLYRDDGVQRNGPVNFAGNSGVVVPAVTPGPALNFQALWWADPPQSEDGWGMGIAHQGNILFVTWFTYDTDGSQMWLVMSRAERTTGNRFEGQIFRTTGPSFSSPQWNPNAVNPTPVGTGVLNFTNADRGTFSYTVNGTSQVKNIVRQEYSAPVSVCSSGGPRGAGNYQDLWWGGESESGWGINITHQGNILFAAWFTYGTDGRGRFIVMSAGQRTAPGVYAGDLYRTTGPAFNAVPWTPAVPVRVGSGTFTFTDDDTGTFAYTVDGVTQAKQIVRQVFSTPATGCR